LKNGHDHVIADEILVVDFSSAATTVVNQSRVGRRRVADWSDHGGSHGVAAWRSQIMQI